MLNMSNVLDTLGGGGGVGGGGRGYNCLQRCTENKFIPVLASLTSLLHLKVQAHCTGPLELGLKLPSSNSFSLVPSQSSALEMLCYIM